MKSINTYSNLNKKSKYRGVVDYRVMFFVIIYVCIVYQILNMFNVSIIYTIYFLVLSVFPIFGIYLTVGREENIVEMLKNIALYLIKPKIYLNYYKNSQSDGFLKN